MYQVFYERSVNLFVGPNLRHDLIQCCYSDFLKSPSLIAQKIKTEQPMDMKAVILCYLIILEANDNPFTVQERFSKRVIDVVFDTAQVYLISNQNSI